MFARIREGRPPEPGPVAATLIAAAWGITVVLAMFMAEYQVWLPLVLGTLLPITLSASRNPRLLLLLGAVGTSVLSLSLNVVKQVHVGGAPAIGLDLVDFFLVPLVIFQIRDRVLGWRTGYRLHPVSGWWLGLILLGTAVVLFGPYRDLAAFEVFRMLKCWLLFLVIVNECARVRQIEYVVLALCLALAVNLGVAFAQWSLHRTLGLQALGEVADDAIRSANLGVYLKEDAVYRVSGLIGHPNLMAGYLAMLLPLLTAVLFAPLRPAMRRFMVALQVCGIAALILTLSRTGWAAYIAALMTVLAFLHLHPDLKSRWRGRKVAMVLGIGLLGSIAAGTIATRLTASDPGALDFRYEWIGIAWKMVQNNPVLGIGLNSFSYQLADYAPYSIPHLNELFGKMWPVVHSSLFLVWSEQGTVGLLLFVGLHLHLLRIAYRNTVYGLSDTITLLNVGASAAIVAILVDGLGSFYIRVPGPARIFWVIAGLVVASHYWNKANAAARTATGAAAQDRQPFQEPTPHKAFT